MDIYTGYYKKFEKTGPAYTLIQVSNSRPSWFDWNITKLPEVCPDWVCVRALKDGTMTEETFADMYRKKLSGLDKDRILDRIRRIAENRDDGQKDVILLCWEKTGSFCHRHILAEWLGNVTEWGTQEDKIWQQM